MFPRKKPDLPIRKIHSSSQFGLTDIPDDFNPSSGICDDDLNDSDLEAELAAISGTANTDKGKPKQRNLVPANELDQMIADCLKDVESDGENDEGAESDSELLSELQYVIGVEVNNVEGGLTKSESVEPDNKPDIFLPTANLSSVDVIKQRIEMYKIAADNANASKEFAKMRRLDRGLKTLNGLLQQSVSGILINPDNIPPAVSVKQSFYANTEKLGDSEGTTESMISTTKLVEESANKRDPLANPLECNPLIKEMLSRQQEYKAAALKSKRDGDIALALQYIKIVKQFDVVVKMCEDGQEVDLSDMPPPPENFKQFMENMLGVRQQQTADVTTMHGSSLVVKTGSAEESITSNETDILEALQERLSKYKSVEESAKAEGNSSKTRRFSRIVKQYEDALKAYNAGHPVAYEELPVPPGFAPLRIKNSIEQNSPNVDLLPLGPQTLSTAVSNPSPSPILSIKKSATPPHHNLAQYSANQQKQMKILLNRQKEFKIAAIESKKTGEIDQAKEYLKIYKGFDAMLNASKSGLPVDLSTLPVPPSQRDNLEASFSIITTDDCDPNDDISDIGVRIEEQLAKQLMMCKNTRDHHKAMGDVAGMNRFENLAVTVQKDLDLVRYSKRKNFPLPKFHYEKRSFNVVHCNTDLTENELEIIIVRGINYNVPNPKEVDTYAKIDFPLLNDETFKAKTNLVKDTDSPDYDQHFKIEIMRGNRQFQRIFKRHAVKFEVYSRGGFLRSDTLIGTANVKLQPLETKCDIHNTFDLVEGRKKVGGKLEIKIRIRNPILTKQIEQINEKWLVIDT